MTIDPELLAAYAEGQLDAAEAARIGDEVARDPALAEEVDAHRALKRRLHARFSHITDAPVPQALLAAVRGEAGQVGQVADLATVRSERQAQDARQRAFRARFLGNRWAVSGALAASLVMGLLIGGRLEPDGPFGVENGRMVARGALNRALSTQLASASQDRPVKVLLTIRDGKGAYCRAFASGTVAGIACREGHSWAIRRVDGVGQEAGATDYRQVASPAGAIMAAAQDMAQGEALDAKEEASVMRGGWKP